MSYEKADNIFFLFFTFSLSGVFSTVCAKPVKKLFSLCLLYERAVIFDHYLPKIGEWKSKFRFSSQSDGDEMDRGKNTPTPRNIFCALVSFDSSEICINKKHCFTSSITP